MNFTTVPSTNTTAPVILGMSPAWGFVACLIASVCFAINYLPVKRYKTGDGMFFQWIMSNSILIGSFVVAAYLKFPTFHPLVMLGGVLWSTGNICVVPIVKRIGLGVGLLLWGSTSIIFGWASGRFGWFGIDAQLPKNFTLNYIGFSLAAISPIMYALVKVEVLPTVHNPDDTLENMFPQEIREELAINAEVSISSLPKHLARNRSKIIGISLSIFSGAIYGLTFIPVMYVKNRYPNASQRDIDYIFAQCSGIYLGSSLYFIVYCIIKRNKPKLYPEVILPGFLSGLLWFLAYIAYFFANEALSPAITQPIVTPMCGVIGTLITVIIFREVRGVKNYLIILLAMVIATTGATLIGISKII